MFKVYLYNKNVLVFLFFHLMMWSYFYCTRVVFVSSEDYFYILIYCCRLLDLLEDFQRGVHMNDDNYTLSATNMQIYIVKLTKYEQHSGIAYNPNEENNVKVTCLFTLCQWQHFHVTPLAARTLPVILCTGRWMFMLNKVTFQR